MQDKDSRNIYSGYLQILELQGRGTVSSVASWEQPEEIYKNRRTQLEKVSNKQTTSRSVESEQRI